MNRTLRKLVERGCLPTDTPDERLKKSTLTIMVIPFIISGLMWGGLYFFKGYLLSAAIPAGYSILSLGSLLLFFYTKRYKVFRFSQIVLILLLPFLLQLSLGGFIPSSGVVLWAVVCPLGALAFYDVRVSVRWFIAFVVLVLVAFALNDTVGAYFNHNIDTGFINAMFMMNIVGVAAMVYIVQFYFVSRQSELKTIVEIRNREISDSIRYARKIQAAILPSERLAEKLLPEHFILYKPKDIVSGDFYWLETLGGQVLFAAVDCTGHGVPGAMVSVVGHNALNQAVNEFGLIHPAEILDKLNELVDATFAKSDSEIKDGMDMALCCLDTENMTLEYAGAHNPLYQVRNGNLEEIKGNRQPIGRYAHRQPFTNHRVTIEKGDCYFIFSDGYADQFGGPNGKKFKYKPFKKLLLDHHNKPMNELGRILDETIEQWRGNLEQIDDICVIGIRL